VREGRPETARAGHAPRGEPLPVGHARHALFSEYRPLAPQGIVDAGADHAITRSVSRNATVNT